MGFYHESTNPDVLRERIAELSRIRQDYTTQLGSSLYEATRGIEDLVWGRESLYEGIAACDTERQELLAHLAELPNAVEQDEPGDDKAAEDEVSAIVLDDEVSPAESVFEVADAEESPVILEQEDISAQPASAETLDQTSVITPDATVIQPLIHVEPVHEEPAVDEALAPHLNAGDAPLCPACGAPVGLEDKFCMNCGTPIQVIEETIEPSTEQTCPNCRATVGPQDKFCMTCGYKLR